jgi:hypothetical protein
MTAQRVLKIVLVAVLQGLPATASACPNCFGATDSRVLDTYYFNTAMLSFLPFFVVGGLVLVARKLRRNLARNMGIEPRPAKILPLRRPSAA